MNWLFKEEPTNYSYDDLATRRRTSWTGVKNPLAQKHLRSVKKGDESSSTTPATRKRWSASCGRSADAYRDPADKTGKLSAVDVRRCASSRRP